MLPLTLGTVGCETTASGPVRVVCLFFVFALFIYLF